MRSIEHQYLELLQKIKSKGSLKQTRNGKVYSIFGERLIHDFKDGFPLLTTKKMSLKNVFAELRWFLDGDTDIRTLWKSNCHIWDNDWYRWFCQNHGEKYTVEELKSMANKMSAPKQFYDLGKIYGFQWRNWGGVDQIANLIDTLKNNPDDRRMVVSAWNVDEFDDMALPPCHFSWQVWTAELTPNERFQLWNEKQGITNKALRIDKEHIPQHDWNRFLKNIPKRKISLCFNTRSQDVPLGTPYNIASYAILLLMLSDEVNMAPDCLIANLGDCHIYENQMEGVNEQISRRPTTLPKLTIKNGINAQYEDLNLINYNPQETIKFPLS